MDHYKCKMRIQRFFHLISMYAPDKSNTEFKIKIKYIYKMMIMFITTIIIII